MRTTNVSGSEEGLPPIETQAARRISPDERKERLAACKEKPAGEKVGGKERGGLHRNVIDFRNEVCVN